METPAHIEEGNRRETGALPAVYTMHVTKNQLECRSVLTPAAAFLLRTMRMRSGCMLSAYGTHPMGIFRLNFAHASPGHASCLPGS